MRTTWDGDSPVRSGGSRLTSAAAGCRIPGLIPAGSARRRLRSDPAACTRIRIAGHDFSDDFERLWTLTGYLGADSLLRHRGFAPQIRSKFVKQYSRLAHLWVRLPPVRKPSCTRGNGLRREPRPSMALPSYLVRRDGGRYHVQMRLGTAMARALEPSHLRFSLRTSNGRQARRRLVECLEWAYAFKEAPDLESVGAAIARRLVKS